MTPSTNPDSLIPTKGSPALLRENGVLVASVYLLFGRWWAVRYPWRCVGKFETKRRAVEAVG